MEYFTIVMLENSQVQQIADKPREFSSCMVNAVGGLYYRTGINTFSLGNRVVGHVQKPKSVLEETLYVLKNGVLTEINPHMSHTRELLENDKEKFDSLFEVVKNTFEAYNTAETKELLHSSQELKATVIPQEVTGELIEPLNKEEVIKQWLLDNKIPLTIDELKKTPQSVKKPASKANQPIRSKGKK